MNGKESDIVLKLNHIVNQILSGERKLDLDVGEIDNIESEEIKLLAANTIQLAAQYRDCYGFIVALSCGKLYTEPPRMNAFANPFKQLHSELRHLTWQIQEIADGNYNHCVSFSGDFSNAINKMIVALRERQVLSERVLENENLFRSIFRTSPDGIILCDLNDCIINASNAAYRMFQLTDEINGKMPFCDLIHPEDAEKYRWFIESLLSGNSLTVFAELRIVSQNSTDFWSEQNASLLLDSNNAPYGYIIIIRDISERKIAEAQLLQYTDELDESSRTKDKLFSIIAHDLKSPFSALLGFSKIMSEEVDKQDVDMERIGEYAKILYESATQSFNLLNNLLDWSRLQSDRIVVKPERINLNDIIIDNINIGLTMARGKNIVLDYATPGNYPLVSDRAIIDTILRNLINNAIKYSLPNGYVTVSLKNNNNGAYLVSVQDNGVGIPPEKIGKLFRLDNIESTPGTANEKGTGLGLVLCRDFINKIGGDIWVENVKGQGATFTFSLKELDLANVH